MSNVSATSLARELIASKGLLGLYRGVGATAMRDVTFSIIYFPMFARLNALGPRKKDGSGMHLNICIDIFWLSIYRCYHKSTKDFILLQYNMINSSLWDLVNQYMFKNIT